MSTGGLYYLFERGESAFIYDASVDKYEFPFFIQRNASIREVKKELITQVTDS
jgi:hypothetical protein